MSGDQNKKRVLRELLDTAGANSEWYLQTLKPAREKFEELANKPHDDLGLVLKCHLIVEQGLREYLREVKGLKNLDEARLSFNQCLSLIDNQDGYIFVQKKMIKSLNVIRNKFGHDIDTVLETQNFGAFEKHIEHALKSADVAKTSLLGFIEGLDIDDEDLKGELRNLINEKTENRDKKADGDISIARLKERDPKEILLWFSDLFLQSVAFMKLAKKREAELENRA